MKETLITGAVALLVAIVTGLFTWMQGRKKGSADVQGSINDGFKLLINQMQEERQAAQIEQSTLHLEVRELRKAVARLESHVIELERLLREHSIPFKSWITNGQHSPPPPGARA